MKVNLDPGRNRKIINFLDNIVYSRQRDLEGQIIELKMSIMLQNGNSEMRLAAGVEEDRKRPLKPAILWIPGGGYRGVDKNLMVAEMAFLAEAGYVVASMYYRSSAQGHFPDQIVDVTTAIRFLRAHSKEYEIDPEHIGVIGRSAGGHLATLAALNSGEYESEEWAEQSSEVQACCDMFGPVNLVELMEKERYMMAHDPNFRWKRIEESHGGALMGGDPETMIERAKEASTSYKNTEKICPVMILHGDEDSIVPIKISEDFYEKLVEDGWEKQTEFLVLKHGGHGTPEFFQPSVKERICAFFDNYLKI